MLEGANHFKLALIALATFVCIKARGATIEDTIYLNRGQMMAVDSTYIPYFAFNETSVFDKENKRLFMNEGDVVFLTVINTDSLVHGFDIKGYANIDTLIPPNDTATINYSYSSSAAHIYYDHAFSEGYRYMGASGMIVVQNPNSSASGFYWNMKEHQISFNEDLDQGLAVDWLSYYPEYFTINGNSNPFINQDTNARVVGNVGDTILIYMVNTGQSLHSIHYHGYHAEIVYSSKYPSHVGRLKDTFGVHSMELVIVELVPDQSGEFPVHDHNLVAVSGANIYPNGMFLTLLID